MSFKTIFGGFNGAFRWFGVLSEDREKNGWIHQNYLVALSAMSLYQETSLYEQCVKQERGGVWVTVNKIKRGGVWVTVNKIKCDYWWKNSSPLVPLDSWLTWVTAAQRSWNMCCLGSAGLGCLLLSVQSTRKVSHFNQMKTIWYCYNIYFP